MKKKSITGVLALCSLLASCGGSSVPTPNDKDAFYNDVTIEMKEISKDEYYNKTLAGLLGQFAGFLSGYEFVYSGSGPYIGIPEEWFDFINGPYAGNYTHYWPGSYAEGNNRYDRLKINEETGRYEVASDDDYHIDIFNQTIMKEFGYSSYAVKEAWKKYRVSDWGGGYDAMALISGSELLAPFTGTIESGNRYGWCTEAYIENETLGMNAPGMPNLATYLVDTFASNVGYFDSVIWAKYYAAMYSLAYFENDIKVIMEKALPILPKGSYPYQMYHIALDLYKQYPNDYKQAAIKLEEKRRMLYRLDNIQTDPNVNGGFAILSWLYGNNSYLDTCKYSSIMGYDGDCTAAICTGVLGIMHGFKKGNEEYQKLNDMIYYNGEGIYFNDRESSFPPFIVSNEYFTRIKIDDIIKLYQENFEALLVENGGEVLENSYRIPTETIYKDHSLLFENCDGENRDTTGFASKNGKLTSYTSSETGIVHTGYGAFQLENTKKGEVYHEFNNLIKGRKYRVSSYVTTSDNTQIEFFATDGSDEQSHTFANVKTLINKAFIFEATSKKMKVGFRFADSAKAGDILTFDDYFIEEIERNQIAVVKEQNFALANGKYQFTVNRPKDVKIGEEVILEIAYRHYGNSLKTKIQRNDKVFGSVILSTTSINGIKGYDVVQVPYVFEKDTDTLQLTFENAKINFGNIYIYNQTQYMFR